MSKEEWTRLVRVIDQIAFIIQNIYELPENVCSSCYHALLHAQAVLIDIEGELLSLDIGKLHNLGCQTRTIQ